MSKILSKSAVFIAALALLAAPVVVSAQTTDLYLNAGGGGGGAGTSGEGGVGGAANVGATDIGGETGVNGTSSGGSGGAGGGSGSTATGTTGEVDGADGQDAIQADTTDTAYNTVVLRAGSGGDGSTDGAGGAGGDAIYSNTAETTINTALTLMGGVDDGTDGVEDGGLAGTVSFTTQDLVLADNVTITFTEGNGSIVLTVSGTTAFGATAAIAGALAAGESSLSFGTGVLDGTTITTAFDLSDAFDALELSGENVIGNGAVLVMTDKTLTFNMEGLDSSFTAAMLTVTGQSVELDADSVIDFSGLDDTDLVFGDTVTLIEEISGSGFDADAFTGDYGVEDSAGNEAILGYVLDDTGNALTFRVKSLFAEEDWFLEDDLALDTAGQSYTIWGTLGLDDGVGITVSDSGTVFYAEDLEILGASAVDLLNAVDYDTTSTPVGAYIGSITLNGLEFDDTAKTWVYSTYVPTLDLDGTAGTNFLFGGALYVGGRGVIDSSIAKFDEIYIALASNLEDGQTVLSSVTALDLSETALEIGAYTLTELEKGDTFTLIDNVTDFGDYDDARVYSIGGLVTNYAFDLYDDEFGALEAEYLGEVLLEGAAHSVAMAAAAPSLLQMNGRNLAADLIDAGTLIGLTNSGNQIEMLFGLGGGVDRFELNSEIKSNHFNLNIGPALNLGLVGGTATIGAFFEAGWANYNIINENVVVNEELTANYNGDGKAHYFGGGVLAGVELTSGFHADASLAFGRVTNKFNPEWLDRAGFELKANYFGLHVSAGYLIAINETSGVDVYGKLLWNHQFKADATTNNGQLVQFAAFNSVRTVLGADYTLQLTPQASLSAGLAWEYQFETKQNIVIDNLVVTPANFKGHTGLLNLGLDVKASDNVSLGLGLQGALGQRNGFGGNLSLGFSF